MLQGNHGNNNHQQTMKTIAKSVLGKRKANVFSCLTIGFCLFCINFANTLLVASTD